MRPFDEEVLGREPNNQIPWGQRSITISIVRETADVLQRAALAFSKSYNNNESLHGLQVLELFFLEWRE